jgi:two-component system OmpR family response regulator
VAKGLREAGHTPDLANNGRDGLFLATTEIYDLVILDRMLPKMDGLTILRTLRASEISTPVLVLSALGDVDERVAGLQAGGDDYLSKPYAFAELLARAEALFRRRVGEAPTTQLCVGDLSMDLLARKVVRGDTEIELQPREYTLLELLMRHAGQVVTRTMMLEKVWGYHFDPQTNVIDVHVSRLRTKIDKDFSEPLLKTVRGAGYMLRAG